MRWTTPLGLALALAPAACMQTIIVDQGADGGGGGSSLDGGPLPSCSGPTIKLKPESPELIVALDRSAGMNGRFSDSTELAAARDALDLYAARYQNAVLFGYIEFPGYDARCSSQTACCASALSLPSPNGQAFNFALHACEFDPPSCPAPTSQRPTVPALESAKTYFFNSGAQNQYLLLITNGIPDCGSGQNASCSDAQATVQQMRQRNIVTTVVVPASFAVDDMTRGCLQPIALYGARSNNLPAPYYHLASTPAELTDTLAQLTQEIAMDACHLDPQTSSPMQIKSDTVLSWKGTQVPFGNNGWEIDGNGFIVDVHGKWCESLITGDPEADFKLLTGCDQTHH